MTKSQVCASAPPGTYLLMPLVTTQIDENKQREYAEV
jgi:hypothetical protein